MKDIILSLAALALSITGSAAEDKKPQSVLEHRQTKPVEVEGDLDDCWSNPDGSTTCREVRFPCHEEDCTVLVTLLPTIIVEAD